MKRDEDKSAVMRNRGALKGAKRRYEPPRIVTDDAVFERPAQSEICPDPQNPFKPC